MDEAARREVLEIARRTVEAVVSGGAPPRVAPVAEALKQHCGAFVTLKTHGRLRGCLGQFVAHEPLAEVIVEMAAAATRDERFAFDRLERDELKDLEVEVSVLGPLERIADPLDFELGVHGIYLRRGASTGCFLPQVAEETGWSKEEFLGHCAAGKAGLPQDAWKDPCTQVYRFACEVIRE
jgi:AmmeMemoRadiSam system protein A